MLAGCGDIRVVRDEPNVTTSNQYIKSYKIGEQSTIFIGDPIVKWQDLGVQTTTDHRVYVANTDFKLQGDYL